MKRSKDGAGLVGAEHGLALPALGLACCGLFAHGLLMFTDHVLWDSHWYIPELASNDPRGMMRLFHEIGRPMDYWFLSVFSGRTSLVAVRGLSLLAWIFSCLAAFFVLVRSARLPRLLAWSSCMLAVTLPAFDVLGQLALWPNVAALALFWGGWCALADLPSRHGPRSWVQRLLALMVLAISLNLNSLLVFYYALAAFLFFARLAQPRAPSLVSYALSLCRRFPDFALLPLAFWAVKVVLTPSSGYYAEYNRPSFAPSRIAAGIRDMWLGYIVPEAEGMFGSATLAAAAVLVAVLVVIPMAKPVAGEGGANELRRSGALMFLAGCALLFAAGFPYFAVDQALSSSGWLSRNCILTPLPLGIVLVGAFSWLNSALCPHRPRLWLGPVVALAVAGATASNAAYLRLQAEGAKEQSVARKLSSLIRERKVCVVQLRDYFFISETIPYYPPLIWTFIATLGREAPSAFVLETARTMPEDRQVLDESGKPALVMPSLPINSENLETLVEQTTMPYMLHAIPREGPQAMLVVRPGKYGADGTAIGARYLWTKWAHPSKLRQFVDDLTSANVLDLPPVRRAHPSAP